LRRLENPGEFLRARFIRPEDTGRYEDAGIDLLKISGRGRSATWLLRAAAAYARRRYDGNLVDIVDLSLWRGPDGVVPDVTIDNRALVGFLEAVAPIDCVHACGLSCSVCDTLAQSLVTVGGRTDYAAALLRARDDLATGTR
jgi:hypothetical protein